MDLATGNVEVDVFQNRDVVNLPEIPDGKADVVYCHRIQST